jgi:hypothetical protein
LDTEILLLGEIGTRISGRETVFIDWKAEFNSVLKSHMFNQNERSYSEV